VADPSTVIPLAPFVEYVKPYIDALVPVIITAAIGYAATLFRKWTNIKIDDATVAKITAATNMQAGLAVAKAEDNLAGKSIDAHSPEVTQGIGFLADSLKAELAATGITPDDLAHMVAAEIGKLQAQSPLPATPAFTFAAPKK
jgi:hypothetical protein